MKKQILNFGLSLTRAEKKMIFGGTQSPDGSGGNENPPGGSGGSGGPGGGGASGDCGDQATCTHDGDCYNVVLNMPSSCVAGCCITVN